MMRDSLNLRSMVYSKSRRRDRTILAAVNSQGNDVSPLFAHAEKVIVDDTTKADLEAVYDDAVRAATADS